MSLVAALWVLASGWPWGLVALIPFVILQWIRKQSPEIYPIQKQASKGIRYNALGILFLSALEHRLGYNTSFGIIPYIFFFLGFGIILTAHWQNKWCSTSVRLHPGQKVVDKGLYGIIRHPVYLGSILMMATFSLCLHSWLGAFLPVGMMYFYVMRIKDEEGFLERCLRGYKDYEKKVRWRLIPKIW